MCGIDLCRQMLTSGLTSEDGSRGCSMADEVDCTACDGRRNWVEGARVGTERVVYAVASNSVLGRCQDGYEMLLIAACVC